MKYTKIILITALFIWLIVWIGPMDCFNHGFYCNMVDFDQIYEEDIQRYVLKGQDFEQIFMLTVLNSEGRIVDQETLVLTTVASGEEYQVYMNKMVGIQSILEQDVMRRVGGGEMGNFDPVYWDSLNASVLAKSHSYIHLHLNYVLWYFGFVQICIYIICKQVMGKESYAL